MKAKTRVWIRLLEARRRLQSVPKPNTQRRRRSRLLPLCGEERRRMEKGRIREWHEGEDTEEGGRGRIRRRGEGGGGKQCADEVEVRR